LGRRFFLKPEQFDNGSTRLGQNDGDDKCINETGERRDQPKGKQRTKKANQKQEDQQQTRTHDNDRQVQDIWNRNQFEGKIHGNTDLQEWDLEPEMTNATLTIRGATLKDAADLVIIDNMASHGMSLEFWLSAAAKGEGENPLSIARERFADPQSVFGWTNALVAEMEGQIVGAVTTYEMPENDDEIDMIKREFPSFFPVFELFGEAEGDWFIDSLAVYPANRGIGIGGQLVDKSLDKGRAEKFGQVSLVVEDTNVSALNMYHKRGFKTRKSLPYVQGETKTETENWLLLSASL
jgi:ribosomal protein S18 acetylase RimI-like enzyme